MRMVTSSMRDSDALSSGAVHRQAGVGAVLVLAFSQIEIAQ